MVPNTHENSGRFRSFSASKSVYFSEFLYCYKKCASHFLRETRNKTKHYKGTTQNAYLIRQSFKVTIVNRALPSLHGGSVEIIHLQVKLKLDINASIFSSDLNPEGLLDYSYFAVWYLLPAQF